MSLIQRGANHARRNLSRVSTTGQTTENQRLELERVAQQRGWEIVGVYEDAGISGARGATNGRSSIGC